MLGFSVKPIGPADYQNNKQPDWDQIKNPLNPVDNATDKISDPVKETGKAFQPINKMINPV